MADEQNTPEVAAIVSRIESWLNTHQNRLELDLTNESIPFEEHSGALFTANQGQVSVTLGFNDGVTKDSSIEKLRSKFNFIALDRLPVPGLDGVPSKWQIYPQTPVSSFSEGVTLEQYNSNTQILQLTVETKFFAIYGNIPQVPQIGCGAAPKGTYLQVRRDIQGIIKLKAKLVFSA
ncbi:unnamed protein product [Rotaria sordida]|uniref:Uncharacterized protein n=1 Tax=Rotaria sordida TaxID=392033 RepID=A0A814T943_9BILA|nr:unnamed protein product [Rotaria sordida]CAF4214487.1 unnamed protein product [Rotaria sordida]